MDSRVNENVLLFDPKFIGQKDYWIDKLSGYTKEIKIFPGKNPGAGKHDIREEDVFIPGEISGRLLQICNRNDLAVYIVLLSALKALLYHYSHKEDLMVISPVCKLNESEETINKYVYTRDLLKDELTFKELLHNVRDTVVQAYENQDYPVERLNEYFDESGDEEKSEALADVVCSFSGLHSECDLSEIKGVLSFSFGLEAGAVKGIIRFDAGAYDGYYIKKAAGHFIKLLGESIQSSGEEVAGLSFLSEEEKNSLLHEFNHAEADYPGERTIDELFEEQVDKTPDNTALTCTERMDSLCVTYRHLSERASRLAGLLKDRGVKPGVAVGIFAEHSPETVTGILGAIKAGGAYLAIDPGSPGDRVNFMLHDSSVGLLLATADSQFDTNGERDVLYLDDSEIYKKNAGAGNLVSIPNPGDPVYIIYTSGTTGKPKGAVVEHRGLVNYIFWAANRYVGNEVVNFPFFTSLAFDLTVTSIFTPLTSGSAIVIYGSEDPGFLLAKMIEYNMVDVIKLTPSHLKLLKEIQPAKRTSLKKLIVGGEIFEADLAGEIYDLFGGKVEIFNEYGPTETVVGCMIEKFAPDSEYGNSIPIGNPAANVRIYLLDKRQQPVPIGVAGEIYISGDCVFRGYVNAVELSGSGLAKDPFFQGNRMYRSGDLAIRLPGGKIEYLYRLDQQVKIRGYRIEIGEIESLLLKHARIREAVVTVHETESGEKSLYAYVVADDTLPEDMLREYLSSSLPGYLVPSCILHIDKLPLTANGKIDKKSLPLPREKEAVHYERPRDETEKKLVRVWSQVLGMEEDSISIAADFFDIGGHSLKAMILTAKIHKELNVKIPLSEIFKIRTIKAQVEHIKHTVEEICSTIPAVEKREYYPLSSAQKRLFVLEQVQASSYNIPDFITLTETGNKEKLEDVFKKVIERHEGFRTSFVLAGSVPVQRIHENVDFAMEYYRAEAAEVNTIKENFSRPYDLGRAPLFRAAYVEVENSSALLLFDLHHIITDAVSQSVLRGEFVSIYSDDQLPEMRVQYKDYAKWQNSGEWLAAVKEQENFWLAQFDETIPQLNFPYDFHKETGISCVHGYTFRFRLGKELTGRIRKVLERTDTTMFMLLLTAYVVLLYKYTRQSSIIIGTPVIGRTHGDLETIIGMFVNMLALKCSPAKDQTCLELLLQVKENSLNAFMNQDYQFDDLVGKLRTNRRLDKNQLVETVFTMQNTFNVMAENEEQKDTEFEDSILKISTIKYFLTLDALEHVNSIDLVFSYSSGFLKHSTIKIMKTHYSEILEQVVNDPGIKIKNITLSSSIAQPEVKIGAETESVFNF